MAFVSFGALAEAREDLGNRRKRPDHDEIDAKLLDNAKNRRERFKSEALERKAGKKGVRNFSRPSKHAPAEVSSKKAVSRKREVVPPFKVDHRDPRFEPLSHGDDRGNIKKNYAFLESYRNTEISILQSALCETKHPETKEKLKRALLRMESRKQARKNEEQQQEIVKKHRKEEKEKISLGKKPFYLKKSEQKKMVLVDRFEAMKREQVEKVIERRRKKKTAIGRKGMPGSRRT